MKKRKRQIYHKNKVIIIISILFVLLISIIIFIFSSKKIVFSDRIEDEEKYVLTYQDETFDTVGWIQVQGTNIDYPIVYHEGGDSSYPVEISSYAWLSNYEVGFHNHIKVSGHNIFNLSNKPELHSELFERFEELLGFVYYDFSKKNQYIQLTMGKKEYIYKIFAVDFLPLVKRFDFPLGDDYTEKEINQFLKIIKENSIYDYNVDVNNHDSIITLLTCTRFFGDANYDFRVVGRLLRDGEKTTYYGVKKNKNYDKVNEILRGDEENENI